MVDWFGAVRTFLAADSATNTITGGRIYGGSLPDDELGNQPRAALILRRAGGGVMGNGQQTGDKRLDIHAYGADEKQASDVFDAAYEALKYRLRRQLIGNVLIHYANVSSDGADGHDPQTGWPITIGSFNLLVAEVPASN